MSSLPLTRESLLRLPPEELAEILERLSPEERVDLGFVEDPGEAVHLAMNPEFEAQMRSELGLD
jgi:hypothetical protein